MVTVTRSRAARGERVSRSGLALSAALVVGALVVPAGVHAAARHTALPAGAAEAAAVALPPPAVVLDEANPSDALPVDALEATVPLGGSAPAEDAEALALTEIAHWEEAAPIVAPAVPAPAISAPATIQLQRAQLPAPATQAQDSTAPVQAVMEFYAAIAQRRLDGALQTWSPRMRAAYPPGVYLYDRFAGTRQMTVRSAVLTSMDPVSGRATVAVELAESSSIPAFNRSWSGTWYLVRAGTTWLLDAPSFRV